MVNYMRFQSRNYMREHLKILYNQTIFVARPGILFLSIYLTTVVYFEAFLPPQKLSATLSLQKLYPILRKCFESISRHLFNTMGVYVGFKGSEPPFASK